MKPCAAGVGVYVGIAGAAMGAGRCMLGIAGAAMGAGGCMVGMPAALLTNAWFGAGIAGAAMGAGGCMLGIAGAAMGAGICGAPGKPPLPAGVGGVIVAPGGNWAAGAAPNTARASMPLRISSPYATNSTAS